MNVASLPQVKMMRAIDAIGAAYCRCYIKWRRIREVRNRGGCVKYA